MIPGLPPLVGFLSSNETTPLLEGHSLVFNGVDEYLQRTQSSSTSTVTTVTISFWIKHGSFDKNFNVPWFFRDSAHAQYMYLSLNEEGDTLTITGDNGVDVFGLWASWPGDTDWHHVVLRFDTSNATAANRCLLWIDGVSETVTDFLDPIPQNYDLRFFLNSFVNNIGSNPEWEGFEIPCKLAFIDLVHSVQAPTAFGETISSVWTRKPFTGSYGDYGFSIDGTTETIGQDVGPNELHYTPINMDETNYDTDLPPHIMG